MACFWKGRRGAEFGLYGSTKDQCMKNRDCHFFAAQKITQKELKNNRSACYFAAIAYLVLVSPCLRSRKIGKVVKLVDKLLTTVRVFML